MAERSRRERVERNIYLRHDAGGRTSYVVGYRDSSGKQRWQTVHGGITAARRERDKIAGAKAKGERVASDPKLTFGKAAEKWLAEQVATLRPATQANYRGHVERYLAPRWGKRRMDKITVTDAAQLVRELRAEGLAEWTISGAVRVAGRVFKYAARHCGWYGQNPLALLENGERAKVSKTPERRIYSPDELAQTIAAAPEPWRTLFALAAVTGARESELLGLWWNDLDLTPDAATVRFTHQVDRQGKRVALKTDESKATLPLPRATAALLIAHKARASYPGPRAYVFGTRDGGPLDQRNVLRALYRAQRHARTPEGLPTFPDLFAHDERGHLVVDAGGAFVLARAKRRDLDVPDFHALRHTAAMDCEDAEEARDLLRHKDSTVTRMIYRGHFDDRRRQALRARMEARDARAAVAAAPAESAPAPAGEVRPMLRAG